MNSFPGWKPIAPILAYVDCFVKDEESLDFPLAGCGLQGYSMAFSSGVPNERFLFVGAEVKAALQRR
jgi:hypothetical protein